MPPSHLSRRHWIASLLSSPAFAQALPTHKWMLGRWIGDGARTATELRLHQGSLSPEQRERLAIEASKMYYLIKPESFTVGGWAPGDARLSQYRIFSETSSSITLEFPGRQGMPPLTLYRESENTLFVRTVGNNLEYLKRIATNAA